MTALPPRRNPTPAKTSKQHLTPLQTLLQMGFPKHRAEKALAATGNKGTQSATDWLLSHANDPLLDDNSPREYILYACPSGEFLEQLQIFWDKSRQLCGWNGAHNFTPHITLVSFYKAPDEDAPHLALSLKAVMEKQGAVLDEPLKLETYTSPNFMGFFVAEEHADYLKRIAMQYVKEVSNATISLEPHVKSLHLTLAYQFPSPLYTNLKSLVDELNPSAPANWELRLYSRDSRVNGKQVHKVKYPYTAAENDELDLRLGDHVYISSEVLTNSPDGWVEATSWLTGTSGFIPESYTERTAESEVWTLHQTVALTRSAQQNNHSSTRTSTRSFHRMSSQDSQTSTHRDIVKNGKKATYSIMVDGEEIKMPDYVNMRELKEPRGFRKVSDDTRKIFLMRHAERVDFIFKDWLKHAFDESGNYHRIDLNMPPTLPPRKGSPLAYLRDGPITRCGMFQASVIGEAMKEVGLSIDHVYCSPSYRSIQTCNALLTGRDDKHRLKIKVEPTLFEHLAWYPEVPSWLSTEELLAAGYNIDAEYKPSIEHEKLLSSKESCEDYYNRSHSITKDILDASRSGNVLVVGHAATLEVCSRQLLGGSPKTHNDLIKLIQKVPYCGLLQLSFVNNKWEITEPPFPHITHGLNLEYDYKMFIE